MPIVIAKVYKLVATVFLIVAINNFISLCFFNDDARDIVLIQI